MYIKIHYDALHVSKYIMMIIRNMCFSRGWGKTVQRLRYFRDNNYMLWSQITDIADISVQKSEQNYQEYVLGRGWCKTVERLRGDKSPGYTASGSPSCWLSVILNTKCNFTHIV